MHTKPKIKCVKVCQSVSKRIFSVSKGNMTSETSGFPEPLLWTALGTLITAIIGGVSWLCTKKCRNQECEINSGCCRFHSDSRLKQTIREEIARDRKVRDLESQTDVPSDVEIVNLSHS